MELKAVLQIRIRKIRMFLGLLDPDPLVRVWLQPQILLSANKNSEKNL